MSIGWAIPHASTQAATFQNAYDIPIPILSYHKIDRTAPTEWFVAADQFARQMDVLKAYGYQTISLYDYMNYVNGNGTSPEKPIIITFDDGFRGVYDYAIPALKARGMSAMLFQITGKLGDSEASRQDNRSWQNHEPVTQHMTWPESFAAYGDGFFIESHTVDHLALDSANANSWSHQILDSRSELQSQMPTNPVHFFAYPYGTGAHTEGVRQLVQEAGYRAAVSFDPVGDIANPSKSDLWALPRRFILSGHSLELDSSDPWWFFMRRVDPEFPIPNASLGSISFSDQSGRRERAAFYTGETITVTVDISNYGSPVPALASLNLASPKGSIFDSSTRYPVQDVLTSTLKIGNSTNRFSFVINAPAVEAQTPISSSIRVRDPYNLLGYYTSPPKASFTVQPLPISARLDIAPARSQSEIQELVFSVASLAENTEEMYLVVSYSHSLEVIQTQPVEKWTFYPPGSHLKANGCDGACIYTSDPMHEAHEISFGGGEKVYRLYVRPRPGFSGPHWLRYRLSMSIPESLTPGFLRDPLVGGPDQQRYPSNFLVIGRPVYLPLILQGENIH